jgi:hypothetical protein
VITVPNGAKASGVSGSKGMTSGLLEGGWMVGRVMVGRSRGALSSFPSYLTQFFNNIQCLVSFRIERR